MLQAAVDAAKAGNHTEALELYEQLFRQLKGKDEVWGSPQTLLIVSPSCQLQTSGDTDTSAAHPMLLFHLCAARHLSHPQQFVAHSNKAASHLVLGQHYAALQVRRTTVQQAGQG